MAYVLIKDGSQDSHENFVESWRQYSAYLDSIAGRLPPSARAFALADWHHNFSDHRSPHDAWVESVWIYEKAVENRADIRQQHIKLRLLGAYHDGHIELEYINVFRYKIGSEFASHGDWLYDEVRLSDDGLVLHEIEIAGTTWMIECEDIRYAWLPAG